MSPDRTLQRTAAGRLVWSDDGQPPTIRELAEEVIRRHLEVDLSPLRLAIEELREEDDFYRAQCALTSEQVHALTEDERQLREIYLAEWYYQDLDTAIETVIR
jgi:hypothetical protein